MPNTCKMCDFIGPLPRKEQAARDLHRSMDSFTRSCEQAFRNLQAIYAAASGQIMDDANSIKSAFALVNEDDSTHPAADHTPGSN